MYIYSYQLGYLSFRTNKIALHYPWSFQCVLFWIFQYFESFTIQIVTQQYFIHFSALGIRLTLFILHFNTQRISSQNHKYVGKVFCFSNIGYLLFARCTCCCCFLFLFCWYALNISTLRSNHVNFTFVILVVVVVVCQLFT